MRFEYCLNKGLLKNWRPLFEPRLRDAAARDETNPPAATQRPPPGGKPMTSSGGRSPPPQLMGFPEGQGRLDLKNEVLRKTYQRVWWLLGALLI